MRYRTAVTMLMAAAVLSSCDGGASSRREVAKAGVEQGQATGPVSETSRSGGEPGAAAPASYVIGSCLEAYGPDTLARRGFAFEGTLVSVEPAAAPGPEGERVDDGTARATFAVRHWYRGGGGDSVVLRSWGLGSYTSTGGIGSHTSTGGVRAEPGDRLLVTGEEDIAWDCGFTQPWTEERAVEWGHVFAAG